MDEDRSEERADNTDITRKDVLRASSRKKGSGRTTSMEPSQRRTFLSRTIASVLGIMGLSGVASASPDSQTVTETIEDLEEADPQAVAKTLEEHREFIEVLVKNDVMSDKILQDMDEISALSVAKSSYVVAKKDEDAGYVLLTFPKESDELGLAFGDEYTDISFVYPDDVDGKAITEELNREVSGVETTNESACPGGKCLIPDGEAQDRCTYLHFPVGRCGSYACGTVLCQPNTYCWCCACCGGGHSWCGSTWDCGNKGAGIWC